MPVPYGSMVSAETLLSDCFISVGQELFLSYCLLLSLFFVFNFQKFDYVVSLCLFCLGFAQLLETVGLYLLPEFSTF